MNTQPTPAQPVVYELSNGGRGSWSRVGVFTDIGFAKQAAAAVLDTYHAFDTDEGTEGVNYDAQWTMRRDTIGARRHEVGDPKPFLDYGSDGSAFKIDTITLNTGRSTGKVIYQPTHTPTTPPHEAPPAPDIATLRGLIRMAALTVMNEVDETDPALATAIAIKASIAVRDHLGPDTLRTAATTSAADATSSIPED